jgi:hypothetical protein
MRVVPGAYHVVGQQQYRDKTSWCVCIMSTLSSSDSGPVYVRHGKRIPQGSRRTRSSNGLCIMPDDRKMAGKGCVLPMSPIAGPAQGRRCARRRGQTLFDPATFGGAPSRVTGHRAWCGASSRENGSSRGRGGRAFSRPSCPLRIDCARALLGLSERPLCSR